MEERRAHEILSSEPNKLRHVISEEGLRKTEIIMRIVAVTTLSFVVLATGASAQVQQNNPNAANQSMGASSQMRSVQQQSATQSDINSMNAARNQAATPAQNTGSNAIGPIGRGTGIHR